MELYVNQKFLQLNFKKIKCALVNQKLNDVLEVVITLIIIWITEAFFYSS